MGNFREKKTLVYICKIVACFDADEGVRLHIYDNLNRQHA